MGEKTAGVGHFLSPAAPAVGITVAQSASANTFGTLTQIIASTSEADYITGIYISGAPATNIPTYVAFEIAVIASTIVDMGVVDFGPTSGVAATAQGVYKPIFPPVPIANATKILVATASSVASAISWKVTLEMITQANVVDNGVAESSNFTQLLGTAVSTPATAGILDVNLKNIVNAAVNTALAQLGVNVVTQANIDFGALQKTSLNAATPASVTGAVGSVTGAVGSVTGAVGSVATGGIAAASFAAGAINAAAIADAAIDRATFAADTGHQTIRSNTAAAGAAGTITLDASASAVDSFYNGCLVYITGGTGVGQARLITGYVGSTQVATVDHNWATNPGATSTFAIIATDLAKLDSSLQVTAASVQGNVTGTVATLTTYTGNTPQTGDAYARIGAAGAGLTALGDTRIANLDAAITTRTKPADTQAAVTTVTNLTNAPTAGDFTAAMKTSLNAATPASVVGAVGSVTGAVGSVTGNVGGSVASVTARVTANTDQWAGGAIPAPSVTGVPLIDLKYILGTVLTETSGQIAAAFKKFFNIATPASTMDALTLVATATNLTNAPTAGDFTAAMKTSLNNATPAVTVSDKTGFSLSAAGVQAVWDALTAALTTVGSIGKLLATDIDAAISSRSTYAGGAVASVTGNVGGNVTGSVGSVVAGVTVTTNNDKTGYGLTAAYDPAKTAAQAGDAMALTAGERTTLTAKVWDALLTGITTAATIGKLIKDNLDAAISTRTKPADTQAAVTTVTSLTNAPTAGDFTAAMKTSLNAATPAVTVSDKTGFSLSAAGLQAIWDALTSALTTAGSVGKLLVDNLNATVSSRLASAGYTAPDNAGIAAVQAKTDNLPASPAAVGSAMTLTAAYDAAKTAAQAGDAMTLTAAYDAAKTAAQAGDAMALTTAAQAAAADKLLGRNLAGGADGTRTVRDALRMLRNRRAIAAGTLTVYQEDDTAPAWTATVATAAGNPVDRIDPA